jgi:cation diffusion facilitator CzcD-associated flavoprotein CzcO
MPGLETFPDGKVIHSSQYENPSAFRGKRVPVIGAGFGGAEMAADLAIPNAEVFHVFTRSFYVLPRHLPNALFSFESKRSAPAPRSKIYR